MAISIFGIYAIGFRRVNFAKAYFFLAPFNMLIFLYFASPWFMLACDCSDYYQCRALGMFARSDVQLVNKFPIPFGENPVVPYGFPPMDDDDESHYHADEGVWHHEWHEDEEDDHHHDHDHEDDDVHEHAHDHHADDVLSDTCTPPVSQAWCTMVSQIANALKGGHPQTQALLKVKHHMKRPFRMYTQLEPGIKLVSQYPRSCVSMIRVTPERIEKALAKFRRLFAGEHLTKAEEAPTELVNALFHCGFEASCTAVSVAALQVTGGRLFTVTCLENESDPALEELQEAEQSVLELVTAWSGQADIGTSREPARFHAESPTQANSLSRPLFVPAPESTLPRRRLFLLKDTYRAGDLQTVMEKLLYTTNLEHLGLLQYGADLRQDDCVCSRDENCLAFMTPEGKARYWCYLRQEGVPKCLIKGFQVYLSSTGRWWSYDVCERYPCECWAPADNSNRGDCPKCGVCPKCLVGYSSACADRERVNGLNSPFTSSIPCLLRRFPQDRVISVAEVRCGCIRAGILVLLLAYVSYGFLMLLVTYKFVDARCGDFFVIEEDVKAIFSSDSDSSDDFHLTSGSMEVEMVALPRAKSGLAAAVVAAQRESAQS